jgi:HK97 family phage major capsid protein
MGIQELREQRGQMIADARKILDKAQTEKRDLTADENGKADELLDGAEAIATKISGMESAEARSRRLDDLERAATENRSRPIPTAAPARASSTETRSEIAWKTASGERRFVIDPAKDRRATSEYRSAFEQYLVSGRAKGLDASGETRDLAADSDVDGGYLVAPTQTVASLIQAVDDAVVVRQFATVIPVRSAQNLGVPVLDTDVSDADWTTEIQTGTKDTAMKFGKRELNPVPLAKRILVSRKLLRTGALPVESIVQARLAYKFGVSQEKGFLTGSGANEPLGMFTPTANGISTSRDVNTGSSTNMTADGLIDAKFALKASYWSRPSTAWLFSREAVKLIRKLKDQQNQYLWQPGLVGGEPDRILDIPYVVSEFVPNTFTTAKYVGILGDMSFYWIAEALSLEVQRLSELYAEANQIGYIGRMEVDAMPVLEEAFVRLKTN